MTTISDDLMAHDVILDPHSYYHEIRETDPVHWNERWGGWVLTKYDDVVQVLRDSTHFSSDRMAFLDKELTNEQRDAYAPIFKVLSKWIVFRDPPMHTKLRLLLNPHFTPRAIERYRPMVRGIVKRLLDKLEGKGQMELLNDFAYQVPMSVLLELIGAPLVDREKVKEWSEQLGAFFFIRADEPRRREIACEGINSLVEYLRPIVAQRREHPGVDLISLLLGAEETGDITEDDVIATCVLLVFGGHETTMNLIANGTLALINHPDQWDLLKQNPGIIENAIEELLRFDGSVKATVRWVTEDVTVGGKLIKKGDRVLVSLSAANRDPGKFQNPDVLDLTRDPNPHVAFANGIHVCLGAALARMELQEVFTGITQRLPCPVLETENLEYHATVVNRALESLPISWKVG
ncbi:MAG: cytochrome P450 [Saprospiraceae bacterium]|nr:cytochrome P450 [Saprospiraceae bacterium]